ncbi:ATP-binding cassette domain-containing protein [Ideonella sp. DXS29W]|uniref:ATP-binding cassette domain-containing protein n=1 Tax=Ideonella lacteola TaxID=2984193 RepID=A0ABU9BM18_9BURK
MSPRAPLLELRQAIVPQGGRRFGPFDATVQSGERIAVLGPSGAGKSTLLRLIAGESTPATGEVRIDGQPNDRWSLAALAERRAVLPQSHAVAFGLPVALVVGLGRLAREPDPARPQVVRDALRAAQAGHLHDRRFDSLSGGEQARVQLARVLAQLWDVNRGLLLVDEPLAALDPALQMELMDTLQAHALARGLALVAVLHDLSQALSSFDRLWLVQEGRMIESQLRADVNALPALERLYGVHLHAQPWPGGGVVVAPRRAPSSLVP